MKRLWTLFIILLFSLSTPAAVFAKKPVEKLKDRIISFDQYNAVMEEIIDQGDASIPDLVDLLKEKSPANPYEAKKHWDAQVTAMNLLSELKARDALDILRVMLENSDSLSAINNAARTIGRIGGNKAFKILEEVYINAQNLRYDQNEERLRAVIAGLGLCGNKKGISLLEAALNNPNNTELIRIYAAGSLGLLGIQDGLDAATAGLDSDDEYVRLAATRALGLIGSSSSVSALNNLSGSNADYVYRKSAKLSLMQIETAQLPDDKKPGYIKKLLKDHPETTEFVVWGTMKLKQMKTSKAKKVLEELSVDSAAGSEVLKHAAKIRLKTMDK